MNGGGNVLLVDHDEAARERTGRILQSCGLGVLEAPDGRTAIRIASLRGVDLDLLLASTVLPHTDPVAMAREVIARHPNAPVLFVTGWVGDPRLDPLPGGASLLVKPFSEEELSARVRELLRTAASSAA